mmetsp:Transcript_8989/g.25773  ORF Transcript_8989/g.25773 Transcript_8989/m.25773 type:complete len:468 (-) Transcript_8989:54-1457(-)
MPPRGGRIRLAGALAAGAALLASAVRLDAQGGAGASLEAQGEAAKAAASAEHAGPSEADREMQLLDIAKFVEGVDPAGRPSLSHIQTLLYHFERFRAEVLSIGSGVTRPRIRALVRKTLKAIRTKRELLTQLAELLEADGQVADGGDKFPSERDNVCNRIEKPIVDKDVREQVKSLCKALDTVRSKILAGEGAEEAVLNVNGRLVNLQGLKGFDMPGLSYAMAQVLGEEFRWVTKQLDLRLQASGGEAEASAAPVARALRVWMEDVGVPTHSSPAMQESKVMEAYLLVDRIQPEHVDSLRNVRNCIHTLQVCKEQAADFITGSEPELRERIREILRMIKDKTQTLKALEAERVAAGEADEVLDLYASQRDTVCKHVEERGLEAEMRNYVARVCELFDRLRDTALADGDTDAAMMDIIGRMNALKTTKAVMQLPIVVEVDAVFSEECRWLVSYKQSREQGLTGEPQSG